MSSSDPDNNNSSSNQGNSGHNQDEDQQDLETRNNNVDVQIPAERGEVSLSTSYASSLPQAEGASGSDEAAADGSQVEASGDADGQAQVEEQQGVARARSRSTGSSKSGSSADEIKRLKRESNILTSLPDPILAVDVEGFINFANLKMEQLLELELDDLVGTNISLYIAPESIEGYERMIRRVVNPGGQHAFEIDTLDGDSNVNRSGSISSNSRSKGSDRSDRSKAKTKSSSPTLKVNVDGEDVMDSSENRFEKQADASEEAPPVKRAKFNADAMKEREQGLKPPAAKIQHHPRVGSAKRVTSTSGTGSSSPTGGTSSSPTEKQESQSSSVDSSISNKPAKGKSPNSSDSGYGERTYSPEEYKDSSPSTVSNAGQREGVSNTGQILDKGSQREGVSLHLPITPAYVICLIRKDLSKVWCELTASIRTRSVSSTDEPDSTVKKSRSDSSSKQSELSEEKELLLCFRPITQGIPDSDITSSSNSGGADAMLQGDRSHASNGSRSSSSRSNGSSKRLPVGDN